MSYPSVIDSFSTKVDDVDDVLAAHINAVQAALVAVETKVGVDGSAVTTTLDYKLKNTASVDPGHKHSDASLNSLAYTKLAYSGLTANHALIASAAGAAGFRAIQETDLVNGSTYPRLGDTETIGGAWTFNGTRPAFKQGLELGGAGSEAVRHVAAVGAGTVTYSWPSTFSNGQFLQVGAGGALTWATTSGGGGGWQDDGTVVRPSTLSDQVAVGTASPAANSRLHVEAAGGATDILVVLKHAATPTGAFLEARNSGGVVLATVTAGGAFKSKANGGKAAILAGQSANVILGADSSGYFGINIDTEANLLTAGHLAVKIFGNTNTIIGDLAAAQADISAQLAVISPSSTKVGLKLRAAAASSVSLQQWQDSAGLSWASMSATGVFQAAELNTLAGGLVRFYGSAGGFVAFQAAPNGGSTTYIWPIGPGNNGQVLTSDGVGNLSWSDKAAGGGGGSSALSALTNSNANNTIDSAAFAQTWRWSLGATTSTGMTFTESVVASGASTIVKVAAITTSTATALSVEHADTTTGKALSVTGGAVRVAARYIAYGPGASFVGVDGAGFFDAAVRWEGTLTPPASYTSTRRFSAFMMAYQMVLPTTKPTNFDANVAFTAMHGQLSSASSASDYSTNNFYTLDATVDLSSSNQPSINNVIAVGGELNYNFQGRVQGVQACFLASVNDWANASGSGKLALFWARPGGTQDATQAGMAFNGTFTVPSGGTLYGLLLPKVRGGTGNTLGDLAYNNYHPLWVQDYVGMSLHQPRLAVGDVNGLGVPAAFGDATTYSAALIVGSQASRTNVSDVLDDKFSLACLGDTVLGVRGHFGVYRGGGLLLMPQPAPVEAKLGGIYVDSDDKGLYFHNGTSWFNLIAGGGGGSGWTDDGTVVRLTASTDKVVIGADTGLVSMLAVKQQAAAASLVMMTFQPDSGSSSDMVRWYNTAGTTPVGRITHDGSAQFSTSITLLDAGTTKLELNAVDTNGAWIALGAYSGSIIHSTARNIFAIQNGVVPGASFSDSFQMYSKDAGGNANKAWPHFRAEDGVPRTIVGAESHAASDNAAGTFTVKGATGGTAKNNDGWSKQHLEDGTIASFPYWLNPAT